MTQDLTKITTPFGLLDAETQEALRAHGGPYEWWDQEEATFSEVDPSWHDGCIYRVKPQPPKPREWWVKHDPKTDMFFQTDAAMPKGCGYIHVREVLE